MLAWLTSSAVHPRVCGERWVALQEFEHDGGSSPRVRGTPPKAAKERDRRRFIPACAGNAVPHPKELQASMVHPRVCGERGQAMANPGEMYGSSPRVRGTPILHPLFVADSRFIPACAGNAAAERREDQMSTVHPRVCGERECRLVTTTRPTGSSPRVRGTQGARWLYRAERRFIPACAGNACRALPLATHAAVHPRVCGERSDWG